MSLTDSLSVSTRRNIMADTEIYPTYGTIPQAITITAPQSIDPDIDPEDMLNQDIEGFDYDVVQNEIFINEKINNAKHYQLRISCFRYLILFFIGFFTGLSAFTFDYCIDKLSFLKFSIVRSLINDHTIEGEMAIPGFTWCAINALLVGIASMMVVYLAPVAAGSGIPQIKCFLNGINVPKVHRLVTLITKGVGVVFSVSGGLAVGKEGPMIHTGAVIAAGLSQGRLTLCGVSSNIFRMFRNDQEKRDFVSAGAAAGVAAAFGAPVGGLLFSLEEGASFVNQRLTWNIFFSSMISFMTLSFFKSVEAGHATKYTQGGLISFGSLDYLNSYTIQDLVIFAIMGVIGGVLGAIFIKINVTLTKFRKKNVNKKIAKILEAMLIASLTASVGFTVMSYANDCRPLSEHGMINPVKMFCSDSEYSTVGELFFQTPEKGLRSLIHSLPETHSPLSLSIFFPLYFILACITYGLWVPSGLFIPTLFCGAAWGRLIGVLLYKLNPIKFSEPNMFALIGAAAMLGGVVRMTVSLTVILMEATGNIIFGLPLIITLVIAKYVGDAFNEGIYDSHIELSGFALLPWKPEELSVSKRAYDVMSSPVTYLEPVMRVGDLFDRIILNPHQAFPITDGSIDAENHRYGTLIGMISSRDLSLLVDKKIFQCGDIEIRKCLSILDYDAAYPRYKILKEVLSKLSKEDHEQLIDLRPYMNHAPYRVSEMTTMDRVFNMFRLLGLRHLPVIDNANQIRGIITRKDIRRFRFEPKGGKIHVEELVFSKQIDTESR